MLALALVVALAAASDSPPPGFLFEAGAPLILTHTAFHAEVQAGLAVVDVQQDFKNLATAPFRATYRFPFPADATVAALSITCGGRRIDGEILCPRGDVAVRVRYVAPLLETDGAYALTLPTAVSPRHRPGEAPDPPSTTLPPHTYDVDVELAEDLPVEALWSDTHDLDIADRGAHRVGVRAMGLDGLPNRDFHLTWSLAGVAPRIGAVAVPPRGSAPGFLALNIEPARPDPNAPVRPRELLMVLDASCSMAGEPWAEEVTAVQAAMQGMRPNDTFDLIRFSDQASILFPAPRPASPEAIDAANDWLDHGFDGEGTDMTSGVLASLGLPRDPKRLRLLLMLTDGFIGDQQEVIDAVRAHLGSARLFSLGVGMAVNHAMLDALAQVGRGDVTYAPPDAPITETVTGFLQRVASPVWTDLAVDWGGLEVTDALPSALPDLFDGHPLRAVARWRGDAGAARIRVTGEGLGGPLTLSAPLQLEGAAGHEAVPVLWTQRKIADLERTISDPPQREAAAAALAKAAHLPRPAPPSFAVSPPPNDHAEASLGASGYGTVESTAASGTASPPDPDAPDRGFVERGIAQHRNEIRYCYQRELQHNPTLAGDVRVAFTIQPDGAVTEAKIQSSTLHNAAVERCVAEAFAKMVFPTEGHGTLVIHYPLQFSPG